MSRVINGAMLFAGVALSVAMVNPFPFLLAVISLILIRKQESVIDEVEGVLGESQRGCGWQIQLFFMMIGMLFIAFIGFSILALGEEGAAEMSRAFAEWVDGVEKGMGQ